MAEASWQKKCEKFVTKYYDGSIKLYLGKNKNFSIEFIEELCTKFGDWDVLLFSPNLTLDIINRCPVAINWEILSYNSNVTCEFIEENLDKPWNWYALSENIILNENVVERLIDNWIWDSLSANPSITSEIVSKWIDKPWNWNVLSVYIKIDKDIVEKFSEYWNWNQLTYNNITEEILEQWIDKPWNWIELSNCSVVNLTFVDKWIDKPWNIFLIIKNGDFTVEFMEKHYDRLRLQHYSSWDNLSWNENITEEIITRWIDKPWNFLGISSNSNLSLKFIEQTLSINWSLEYMCMWLDLEDIERLDESEGLNWKYVSYNKNLTKEFIDKWIDKSWDWDILISGGIIDMDFIDKWTDKPWDLTLINDKFFDNGKKRFIERYSEIIIMLIINKRREGLIGMSPIDILRHISGWL
jgi:hypothetical protein